MNLRRTMAAVALAGAGATAVSAVALSRPDRMVGPPALRDPAVPRVEQDKGAGERLLLVVGGSFPTQEAAETANAALLFGELQGFYVASTDQFVGLRDALGEAADDYVLVSAFRTAQGAKQFVTLAGTVGASAFVTTRLENLGWEYVGLGQEANPDGTGPLTEPIPGLTT